jgi:iron-sulfur cluster assembly protein
LAGFADFRKTQLMLMSPEGSTLAGVKLYFCINQKFMEVVSDAPVKFSAGAVRELKRLMQEDASAKGKYLRVGVKGGGCSGMTYVLNFDEKKANDQVYHTEDFTFIMDPTHEIYLFGMEVQYEDGLNSRGFTFINPNASKTCGCGSSFAV